MNDWLVFIRAFLCAVFGYAVRCACLVSVSLFPQRDQTEQKTKFRERNL